MLISLQKVSDTQKKKKVNSVKIIKLGTFAV